MAAPTTRALPDLHALLPHAYPFLLVDRLTELDPGRRAVGIKRVTAGEWFMQPAGRSLPGPAMPHGLIVEALAQLSAALLAGLVDGASGAVGYFMGLDGVRYRGAACAGDLLRLEVVLAQFRRGICRTRGTASVDGTQIVRARLTTVLRAAQPSATRGV